MVLLDFQFIKCKADFVFNASGLVYNKSFAYLMLNIKLADYVEC